MEQTELELLRLIRTRDYYDKYSKYIKSYTLFPESSILVEDIGEYFKYHPETKEIEWPTFQTWFRINKHPGWKADQHKVFKAIIDNVASKDAAGTDVIARFVELDYTTQINEQVQKILAESNTGGLIKIEELVNEYVNSSKELQPTHTAMVEVNAETLFTKLWTAGDGMEWRLEDLNRSVGPVRKGDLVFVGKRPEVGGTTFVSSELTHMVTQLPEGKHAIIFNNEEIGTKVGMRLIQSALDATVFDIMSNPKDAQERYLASLGTHRIDVYHDTSVRCSDIERVLRTGDYSLVAINVLDKVQGFYKLEGVERLRALSQWARKLADQYGVVIAVAQADASAEGERYLNQSQLYGSKTGMQGEGDVQIMIGKDNEPGFEDTRWISVVKNKTLGGPRVDPALRHGKFEVAFDGEHARFRSRTW